MSETTQPIEAIPRHRFLPCDSLRVTLSDIEPLIPIDRLLRSAHLGETLDLPTATVFAHIVPLLSMSQLSSLCPDYVEPSAELIRLPAQSLAVFYPLNETVVRSGDAPFTPLIDTSLHSPIANLSNLSIPATLEELLEPNPIPEPVEEPTAPLDPSTQEPHTTLLEEPPETLPRKLAEIFPNLPTFRRVEQFSTPPQHPTAIVGNVDSAAPTSSLPEETREALQSLFLTDEDINLPKVIELCGSLPGIESCVLAHEDRVLSSHNVPVGLDLVSLSSHASAMLQSMQDASQKMGIGDIPAVTLHTPKGPLSILQQERLTLIVLHGKRGFIPGVREKMTATLAELNRSQLQLPAPKAMPAK